MIKPVLHTIILLFIVVSLKAQENLVSNGSFEEYYSCPVSNDLNNGQLELVKGWWKPTLGSSDYFNRCNTGVVGVPDNFWGHQEAFHGDAYVGMSLISWYLSTGSYIGNEYIQAKLTTPLTSCVEYHFEMKVNFANYSRYAFGRIGALFTPNSVHSSTDIAITTSPQIINNQGILSDTVKWITISGNFISLGNEQYITIGYFFENVQNDTIYFQDPMEFNDEGYGYYYIDNIVLTEIGIAENCEYIIPNVITANNDGVNDFLDLQLPQEGKFTILNRWGNIIYKNSDSIILWPQLDSNLTEGVYFYVLEYQVNNKKERKTGFIQLIR